MGKFQLCSFDDLEASVADAIAEPVVRADHSGRGAHDADVYHIDSALGQFDKSLQSVYRAGPRELAELSSAELHCAVDVMVGKCWVVQQTVSWTPMWTMRCASGRGTAARHWRADWS